MKEILVLIIVTPWILLSVCFGQDLSDLFGQTGREVKATLAQLVALGLFKNTLEKGYAIAKDGTDTITAIKTADFDMHQAHFDSLRVVGPVVRNDPRVKDIRSTLTAIRVINDSTQLLMLERMPGGEHDPVEPGEMSSAIIQECEMDEDFLNELLKDGLLMMSQANRLSELEAMQKRVTKLYHLSIRLEYLLQSLPKTRMS